MREADVGRVLVASLHQSIADLLPMRLGFYEHWLSTSGLRTGTIGVAPLYAVLRFLRQEGAAYHDITTRAGEYAAEWTVESLTEIRRTFIQATPAWLRRRLVLRLAQQVVRSSYRKSRAVAHLRRGTASLDVRASIFCTVRQPVAQPLCGYYAAALTHLLRIFNLEGSTEVVACRGIGEPACVLKVESPNGRARHDALGRLQ